MSTGEPGLTTRLLISLYINQYIIITVFVMNSDTTVIMLGLGKC